MSAPFAIRPAQSADAAAVAAFFRHHLCELGYRPDPRLDGDMESFPGAYADAPNAFLAAVAPDGALVGMAGLLEGEVRRVFVRADVRNQGVARALVQALLAHARAAGAGEVFAVVGDDNAASQALFRTLGFEATDRRPSEPQARHCRIFRRRLAGAK